MSKDCLLIVKIPPSPPPDTHIHTHTHIQKLPVYVIAVKIICKCNYYKLNTILIIPACSVGGFFKL